MLLPLLPPLPTPAAAATVSPPCVHPRSADMQLLPSLLLEILRHNYSMVHIPWGIAHNSYSMKVGEAPLGN